VVSQESDQIQFLTVKYGVATLIRKFSVYCYALHKSYGSQNSFQNVKRVHTFLYKQHLSVVCQESENDQI